MKFDPLFLAIVLGTVLPIVRGIVTKAASSQKVKTSISILLSAISGLGVQAQQGNGLISKEMAVAAAISFITAQAMFYGVWEPTGISDKVDKATSKIGI